MSALEYLHSKDIVHGNITPDNIIFDLDGYVYLCDFKMATILTGDQVLENTFFVLMWNRMKQIYVMKISKMTLTWVIQVRSRE